MCGLKEPAGLVFINPARCMCICPPPGYPALAWRLKVFCFLGKKGQNKLLNLENSVLVSLFLFFEITETFGPNDCSVKRCGTSSWNVSEKTIDTREVETVCTKLWAICEWSCCVCLGIPFYLKHKQALYDINDCEAQVYTYIRLYLLQVKVFSFQTQRYRLENHLHYPQLILIHLNSLLTVYYL